METWARFAFCTTKALSISDIVGITGFDRKTVRKWLTQPELPRYGHRAPRLSKLDPFKPYIEQRLSAGIWNAQVLLRELRPQGYAGGYTILKDYLHPKRQAAREVASGVSRPRRAGRGKSTGATSGCWKTRRGDATPSGALPSPRATRG